MRTSRIAWKLFAITALLLVLSALVIYLTLYFLLPGYYLDQKQADLEKGIETLIKEIELLSFAETHPYFLEFIQKYNIRLLIFRSDGRIYYFPLHIETRVYSGTPINLGVIPFLSEEVFRSTPDRVMNANIISFDRTITFPDDPYEYRLRITAPLQPIDEASRVILSFLPYMFIPILIISLLGAFVYSHLVSKPLLKLGRTARRLSRLDFSAQAEIHTRDELGDLSRDLNQLAENLKKSMDELKRTNRQLQEEIRKKKIQEEKRREFIATISHELKTPITSVSGQLEGMIQKIGVFKDRDKYLRQSYQIMKEMEKLVQELLEVSQLDNYPLTPEFQPINLSVLLHEALDKFHYLRDLKKLQWKTGIEPDLFIVGDKKLLEKAISNVVSNAVMYTAEGETVEIALKKEQEKICLYVTNYGAHIEEEELPKIFEPFYRMEKSRSRKTGGSGLGLYLVKKIFEIHSIAYSIQNTDKGVIFRAVFDRDGSRVPL